MGAHDNAVDDDALRDAVVGDDGVAVLASCCEKSVFSGDFDAS